MDTNRLPKLLKQRRQLSGLTQAEVANKLHVSRQAISNWETGRHLPDLILVNQLANIYDSSVDELINDDSKAKLSKSPVGYIFSLLMLSILATSRLILVSSSKNLLIMDGLILLSVTLLSLTKIKNLKVQLSLQLITLIVLLGCTFKTSLLNSFGFQTATFLTNIILLCQLVSTYHYQKKE
ncbi:helix-turn-helix transcriptional regulator [Periweissella fabalis]|uniref:Helix-turn-helix domain-containing protein n=1 Tax=Periweissella fabalis TaxID=1070421 RepID=A0A7X6N442_9LACO|nr:helix-turn-helix transcriptional regulator [Periweissella fabalis]MCM0598334.1 helix-turn-helix transcriptional regulator [Periweissella fabalis]NKZ24984.1 helix-turn-helix domain-containing protein [Periweissella fabalis]